MGPLISAGQRESVAAFVPDGAPVAIRGSVPDGPGYWFAPTVLHPVDAGDRAATEEIFGPVACVIPFSGEAEAIRLANDTIYGLSGSVWTRDGAKALRVARALEAGQPVDQLEQLGPRHDAVRRLQAERLRARARARTRPTRTPRSRPSTTARRRTEHMAGRLEGKVCVVTGAERRHRLGDRRGVPARGRDRRGRRPAGRRARATCRCAST